MTLAGHRVLADLLERRKEMDARQHYRRRRQDERHRHVEWVRKQPGRVYVGMDCTTLADRHIKYVDSHSAYWPYTAGELARIYLTDLLRSYGTDRVCDHYKLTERDAALMGIQAPLYFEPERGREGTFVYIDINACYWQLWHRLPLNIAFDPQGGRNDQKEDAAPTTTHKESGGGRDDAPSSGTGGVLSGRHVAAGPKAGSRQDSRLVGRSAQGVVGWPRQAILIPEADYGWLGAEKELRNAMFGMMSGHHIEWWANGKPQRHEILGAFAAPGLAAYVRTTLRQIARVAIEEFGCRMWLTDAGIFEATQGMAFQAWLGGTIEARSQSVTGTQEDGEGSGHEAARPGRPGSVQEGRFAKWSPQRPHLHSSVKAQGKGHLYGLGSYRIGNLSTRQPKGEERVDTLGFSNL